MLTCARNHCWCHAYYVNRLVVGYDVDKCVVDKPCGVVTLSTSLYGKVEVIIVKDATLGQPTWYGNPYYGNRLAGQLVNVSSTLADPGLISVICSWYSPSPSPSP